jgi:hypothetical protein
LIATFEYRAMEQNHYESPQNNGRDGKGCAHLMMIGVVVTFILLAVACGLLGVVLFYLRAAA